MDSIWHQLPEDILTNHVLPFCDIDTRLAFKIKPNKIDLRLFESGDFKNAMKRRYTPLNPSYQYNGQTHVMVPLHTASGWLYGKEGKRAMLEYYIIYDFNSYWLKKEFGSECIHVRVDITDFRDPNKPTNLTKEESEKWRLDDPESRDMVYVYIKPREKP
jgi:hypothetical protein